MTGKIRKENYIVQKSGHESNEIRDRLKNSKLKNSTFWNRAISYFYFDVLAASFKPKDEKRKLSRIQKKKKEEEEVREYPKEKA